MRRESRFRSPHRAALSHRKTASPSRQKARISVAEKLRQGRGSAATDARRIGRLVLRHWKWKLRRRELSRLRGVDDVIGDVI